MAAPVVTYENINYVKQYIGVGMTKKIIHKINSVTYINFNKLIEFKSIVAQIVVHKYIVFLKFLIYIFSKY